MKKPIISPENRDDNDFFDAPRTKEILDLQDENAQKSTQGQNVLNNDPTDFNKQKDPSSSS